MTATKRRIGLSHVGGVEGSLRSLLADLAEWGVTLSPEKVTRLRDVIRDGPDNEKRRREAQATKSNKASNARAGERF